MGSAQSTSCEKLWVSCAPKNGDFQDKDMNDMRNETITVLEIGHYREPSNEGRSMILHDFVGFRVRFENLIFLIKAEKFKTGISVTRPVRWCRDVGTVVPRYVCENLEDCGEIRMEDLLAILKEPSPDYHLLSDNCRSYADATFKQVIRKFSEKPSLSPERRSYLASFLNNAPPLMPDKVLGSVIAAVGKGVAVEVPLSTIIGFGAAAAGAAVVAPSTLATQVATTYTALRCAGIPITPADVQNGLHAYTAAQAHGPQLLHAVHAMNSLVPVHHVPTVPLILNGGVHTTSATQAVHAPLITHSVLHLVLSKAFIIAPLIVKGAVCVAPFVPPVAMAVAGLVFAYALYKVIVLVKDGTSLRQSFKKWWRSHFSRRPLKQAQGLPSM